MVKELRATVLHSAALKQPYLNDDGLGGIVLDLLWLVSGSLHPAMHGALLAGLTHRHKPTLGWVLEVFLPKVEGDLCILEGSFFLFMGIYGLKETT